MSSSFCIRIDNLRKRSRVLLSCIEENARVVREEVKKLRSNDSSINGRNCDVWKLRNDSSSVGAALCPDYFRLPPKYESISVPDMSAHRRLLVRSDRKHRKPSPQRKPVKECYCYSSLPEIRKNGQISTGNRHSDKKCEFPAQCGDGVDSIRGDGVYSPPLSTATLRRAQKIDYTPRSKFLRRVQSKVNSLRSSSSETPRTPSPSPKRLNREANRDSRVEYPRRHNCRVDEGGGDKIPKKTLLPKKTLVSRKTEELKTGETRKNSEPRSQGRRIEVRSPIERETFGGKADDKCSKNYCDAVCPCEENGRKEMWNEVEEPFDFEINNVRKFREKNYFDTHASSPSLLGSGSGSGSIQQFRLNERLFAEPMGRVHREDIVVSIPPCATRQKKSIHYFPRSVVRQEKYTQSNKSVKKRSRCPSCPLIGHAVDLGALRVSHPANSLALRYQKGIP